MSVLEIYEKAQKILEIEASRNNMFYDRGIAFNEDRKHCIIVEIAWGSGKVYFSYVKEGVCVACDTDVLMIFNRVRIQQ